MVAGLTHTFIKLPEIELEVTCVGLDGLLRCACDEKKVLIADMPYERGATDIPTRPEKV